EPKAWPWRFRARRTRVDRTTSACGPLASSQPRPKSGSVTRSSMLQCRLQRADLIPDLGRPLEVLALYGLVQLAAEPGEALLPIRLGGVRRQVDLTHMLRAAVQTPQETPQLALEGHVALRAAHPARLSEVLQPQPAVRTGRHGAPWLGRQPLPHLRKEVREREIPDADPRLEPLLSRALLAQMEGAHLVVHDLREVNDRLVLTAVIAQHRAYAG